MRTTSRRVLARLIVLPLFISPLAVGPSLPAQAVTSAASLTSAPLPRSIADSLADEPLAERFREHRERQALRKARQERREKARARREAAHRRHLAALAATRGERVVAAAAAQAGKPYVYGATGPSSFDCSGLTGWAYRSVGIALPRTAAAQAATATPVSSPVPGDLVFFSSGGHVYHVAIYAGDGQVWHAPHPGDVVRKVPIWTGVFYGRP